MSAFLSGAFALCSSLIAFLAPSRHALSIFRWWRSSSIRRSSVSSSVFALAPPDPPAWFSPSAASLDSWFWKERKGEKDERR